MRAATTPSFSSTRSSPSIGPWRLGVGFDVAIEVVDDRPGYLAFRAIGADAARAFAHEAGGHRYQRVPPTEKRGRVHTSTVTVATLPEPSEAEVRLDPRDLEFRACRGSGAGGQHRNVTASAVQVVHKPTGTTVRVESERSQHQNKATALALLRARIAEQRQAEIDGRRSAKRARQVGSGMRGDKALTVAMQRDSVVHHGTGRRTTWKRYAAGHVEDLWPRYG